MKGTPLRRRLFVLTAACILPIGVMGGISLYALKRQQNAQNDRVGLELARSVANAVDSELRRSISILETLATSPSLDEADFAGFLERARRLKQLESEWAAVMLFSPAGTPLVDSRFRLGDARPDHVGGSETSERPLRSVRRKRAREAAMLRPPLFLRFGRAVFSSSRGNP
jgi:hypothetical protein